MYKQINQKLKTDAARIEFWIVTGFIVIALLLSIIDIMRTGTIPDAISGSIRVNGVVTSAYNYVGAPLTEALFNHLVVFVSYLLLVFYVAPAFEHKDEKASNTIYIFVLIAACFVIGIININFATLLAIKILVVYFNRNKQNKANALYYETALLTASWILIFLGSFYTKSIYLKYYALYDLPVVFTVYLYAMYNILPKVASKKYWRLAYFGRMLLVAIVSSLALLALCFSLNGGHNHYSDQFLEDAINRIKSIDVLLQAMSEGTMAAIGAASFLTQILVLLPLAASVYKKRDSKKDEEIKSLKTELGQSDANLNFLKSQINPHFLFNALNTLFGTALQEGAERTSEGIQKLGDMMRFMLQENTQDKILLSRDIDYLKNYILLQKLRTSTSDSVIIETQITEYTGDLIIAPMLLIPFVENAFKHGISLISPSHIKVTLQTKDSTLYFDVHNSIHIRNDKDPEKGQSGIGLDNVKQRLSLLYPDRHELIIRENATEFFIHITLQLDNNN
ncbi:MAG: histidine kinase [Bacteroidota bacterium]